MGTVQKLQMELKKVFFVHGNWVVNYFLETQFQGKTSNNKLGEMSKP
jgi:hypothetical protein